MRSQLIWCIAVNILAALLSIGVLYLYPADRGFTVGYGTAHYIEGGTCLAALLMICVSTVLAVYLAFRLYAALHCPNAR
jgi:hypothetical protein